MGSGLEGPGLKGLGLKHHGQYISNGVFVQCLYKLLTVYWLYVKLRCLRMFSGLVFTLPKLAEMRIIMLSLIERAE